VQAVLNFYGGNLATALKELFPNIGLEIHKFSTSPSTIPPFLLLVLLFIYVFSPENYWQEKSNRRAFFLNFAKEHKFDPLLPDNWYLVPISIIRTHKVFFACLKNCVSFLIIYSAIWFCEELLQRECDKCSFGSLS
jgi:hypothetical protein